MLLSALVGYAAGYIMERRRRPHAHSVVRAQAIISHLKQAADAETIFLGDSIVELARLPSSVINAGIGGSRVADVLDLINDILPHVRAKRVILEIGINDTAYIHKASIEDFSRDYRKIILLTLASGATPVLLTIAPVAEHLSLGASWFDVQLIDEFNKVNREIAADTGLQLIEFCELADAQGYLPPAFTDDGVHLSARGYEVWHSILERHL